MECLLGMKFQWYKIIKKCRDGYVFRAEHSGCMCSGNNKNYRMRGHEFERAEGVGGNGGEEGRDYANTVVIYEILNKKGMEMSDRIVAQYTYKYMNYH